MKKKVRFLATGDFHSDLDLVEQIKSSGEIEKSDFIVFIGDLSDRKNDFSNLLSMFGDKKIFMVPGNHETKKKLDILKKHYNVHLVGNSPVNVNDDFVLFGTNYLHVGPYGIPEEDVLENIVKNYKAIEDVPVKIHLSHIPPHGTQIGDASPFFPMIGGSVAVRTFLENFRPDFTLVGHIHESSGLEEIVNKTRVVNVGRTFKVFEFDPEKKKIELVK